MADSALSIEAYKGNEVSGAETSEDSKDSRGDSATHASLARGPLKFLNIKEQLQGYDENKDRLTNLLVGGASVPSPSSETFFLTDCIALKDLSRNILSTN